MEKYFKKLWTLKYHWAMCRSDQKEQEEDKV